MARRRLALIAHVAFPHSRQPFIPLVGGYLEGASLQAIAAAHALFCVIYDWPERRFLQRPFRADRSADGGGAMHTETPAESVAVRYGGELVGGNPFFRSHTIVIR